MKWYQDFANIMALLAIPVGLALVFWSEEKELGKYMLAGVFGVAIKAVSPKVPLGKVGSVILLAILLTGCIAPMVPTNVADTITDVCDRHDAWADEELQEQDITALDYATFLEDTKILRAYVEASKGQID